MGAISNNTIECDTQLLGIVRGASQNLKRFRRELSRYLDTTVECVDSSLATRDD